MMKEGCALNSRWWFRNCRQPAVLADVMLSHWSVSAWLPQLPKGWTLTERGDKRELRNARGKLVTEITYINRKGQRVPISIEQHVFKYHITIQYG